MSVGSTRLRVAAMVMCLSLCAAAHAQTSTSPPDLDDGPNAYVADPSQSYVQEMDVPAAVAELPPVNDMYEPLIQAEAAPAPEPLLRNCQGYEQAVIVGGRTRAAYGTACQDEDGSWQVASTPSLSNDPADYQRASGNCREFQQPNVIIGDVRQAYGTACQQPDGNWQLVTTASLASTRAVCRSYEQEVISNGESVSAYGTACEEADGSWRIASPPRIGGGADNGNVPMRLAPAEPYPRTDSGMTWESFTPAPRVPSYRPPVYERDYDYAPRRSYSRPERAMEAPRRSPPAYGRSFSAGIERGTEVFTRPFRAPERSRYSSRSSRSYSDRSYDNGRRHDRRDTDDSRRRYKYRS